MAGDVGTGLRAVGEAEPVGEGQGPAAVANAYPSAYLRPCASLRGCR